MLIYNVRGCTTCKYNPSEVVLGMCDIMQMTKRQREIIHEYKNLGLTQKEIAARRGISQQSVSKVIRKAKKNGIKISNGNRGCTQTPPVREKRLYTTTKERKNSNKPVWRVHNLHFVVYPYYVYDRFQDNVGATF